MRTDVASVLSWARPAVKAMSPRRSLAILVLAAAVAGLAGPRLLDRQKLPIPAVDDQRVQQYAGEERTRIEASRSLAGPVAQTPAGPADVMSGGWGRRVARRAALDVELADVDRGVARLTTLVESLGGFVGATESRTDAKGTTGATLATYVPPAEFAHALVGIDDIGRVTRRVIAGHDVSEEFVDLEARLRNYERHEAQLLSFMNKAQRVQDLLSLESELARVRGEIEQITGRLRFLKGRTDMATIEVALVRAPLVAPPDGLLGRFAEQVKQAFAQGWSAAFAALLTLCVWTAQLSPLGIPLVAAWRIYRYRTGRRQGPA